MPSAKFLKLLCRVIDVVGSKSILPKTWMMKGNKKPSTQDQSKIPEEVKKRKKKGKERRDLYTSGVPGTHIKESEVST